MEVQRQEEEEEEERQRDQHPREEGRSERSTESTFHTVPQLLLETTLVDGCCNTTSQPFLWVLQPLCLFICGKNSNTYCTKRSKSCIFFFFAERTERSRGDQERDGTAARSLAQPCSRNSWGGEAGLDDWESSQTSNVYMFHSLQMLSLILSAESYNNDMVMVSVFQKMDSSDHHMTTVCLFIT